jgi:uncharacterized protein (TIGR02453 family)
MAKEISFKGFNKDSIQLFRDLADPLNNNRVWFNANRDRYEVSVVGKMRELLVSLTPVVRKLNPHFDCSGRTNGNFSRINRDIRFSKDKAPYKLNYYLYFFDERRSRDSDGRLYVGLSGEGLTVGFSIYGEWRRKTGGVLKDVFKKHLVRHRALLEDYLQRKSIRRRYDCYWYSLVEKEWVQTPGLPKTADDWAAVLGWVVRRRIGPRQTTRPEVGSDIQEVFRELYPLYIFSASTGRRWAQEFRRLSK